MDYIDFLKNKMAVSS